MHSLETRTTARRLVAAGGTTVEVAASLGVSQAAVWRWAHRTLVSDAAPPCPLISGKMPAAQYAYLFGHYLGDGHLVTRAKTPVLRVSACTDYPGILGQLDAAVSAVRGRAPAIVRRRESDRVVDLQSYWMHWPCVLPQHGPGAKHTRPIVLAGWQRQTVDAEPWAFVRGLIHSDGCRSVNRVTVRGKTYAYPRYLFANESRDILALMGEALDRVGVAWRYNRPNSVSVARRDGVALMDHHVGPKY